MSEDGEPQFTGLIHVRKTDYRLRRFSVQVIEGPNIGLAGLSDAGEFGIGTGPGNQLVLSDGTVSRHHCSITPTERGFFLRDLGSKNGTTLGGYRVEGAYLKTGALVRVGMTTIRFDTQPEEIRVPLSDDDRFGRALGRSAAMRRIFAGLPRIAASDSAVLLTGETGTGKGLLAEAIHTSSPRNKGPFTVVDCASIAPSLIESEIFGHERGSFTGAHASRPGAFETARGGTVFLDEIGELPIEMQPKLLRVIEERTIRRVGGVDAIRLDARVIAATNRDLRQEVNRGAFRSDLLYRLNTLRIGIPPLRERREDIELLVQHFYEELTGESVPPQELVKAFGQRDWPGNVRELKGAVERAVMFGAGEGGSTLSYHPPPALAQSSAAPAARSAPRESFRVAKERALAGWESGYVKELLREHSGNMSAAARAVQMDRNYLRELLRRHGIPTKD